VLAQFAQSSTTKTSLKSNTIPDEVLGLRMRFAETYNELAKRILGSKNDRYCRILLLGATGAGKSSTVNSFFGREIVRTSAEKSCTEFPEEHPIPPSPPMDKFATTIIDTPGLKDDKGRDDQFLQRIKSFIEHKEIHSVWFVHDVQKTRFDLSDQALIDKLTTVLGGNIWNHAVIVLTRANGVDAFPKPGEFSLDEWQKMSKIEKWKAFTEPCIENIQSHIRRLTHSTSSVPIVLVDNINFEKNFEGESILIDGTPWKRNLVLTVLRSMDEIGALKVLPELLQSPDEEVVEAVQAEFGSILDRLAKGALHLVAEGITLANQLRDVTNKAITSMKNFFRSFAW